jgi:phage gpG-like protein
MDINQFETFLQGKAAEVQAYAQTQFGKDASEISLKFIDGNFRQQGWQGAVLQPWMRNKRGSTILVKTGALRRGNYAEPTQNGARIYNNVKYAAIHNNGFKGMVNIPAHTRTKLGFRNELGRTKLNGKQEKRKFTTVNGTHNVKAHSRNINVVQRKFFPTSYNDSPILEGQLRTKIIDQLKNIIQ